MHLTNEQKEQHKKALLEALEKSLGVVTQACKQAGIGRTTFYEWCKADQEFKKLVDEIESVALDFVESQLFKNIGAGKEASLIFYLKTKGRKRGYCEKIEVNDAPPLPIINLDSFTDEQRQEIVKLAKARRQYLQRLDRQSNGNETRDL